jgi:hypothetical protein
MSGWIEHTAALIELVVTRSAGQVGRLTVTPPDDRVPVALIADAKGIAVRAAGQEKTFPADQSAAAVSEYAAAVEGYA